jgi:hypothetical protein
VLLKFYTPHHGKRVQLSELPTSGYAWVSAKQAADLSQPHRVLGTVQKVSLIQLFNN